jgi:hypothetical protein
MSNFPRAVEQPRIESEIDARPLAERSNVDEQRVAAFAVGRWPPSPEDRDRIAAVFGLAPVQIAWGHKTPVQHLHGQRPA